MDLLKRSRFDKLVDHATNELLIEPDLVSTLAICDLIRGQEISAKTAIYSIKRRLQNDNPNIVLRTLDVLESMMKNCGNPIHEEVATSDFMLALSSLATSSHDVCSKVLSCIQNWAFVFKGKPGFSAIQDVYDELKSEGYAFPVFSESDAMFSVVDAPNWKEEASCHRCKVAFTTFRRRHHCRNCGNSFCAECSSSRVMLPKFGIEKEVRVCDHCLEQHNTNTNPAKPNKEKKPQSNSDEQTRRDKERKDRELKAQEDEELQLALALSASEAESKELERRGVTEPSKKHVEPTSLYPSNEENGPLQLLPVLDTTDMDPELARYLNRHYWENRASAINQSTRNTNEIPRTSPMPQPSAPIYSSPVPSQLQSPVTKAVASDIPVKSGNENNIHLNASSLHFPGVPELTSPKQEEFLNALNGSVEFFVNRMQSNSQRGRSIANDTTVQALFMTLHEMHPQLLQQKQSMEERRAYFEGLQDKLTQLREAREALDALRQEHAARRQLEEQEASRLRQLQMMQKLEVMRQQKRDTLEFRRRMALEQTMQFQQQYHPQPQMMQHPMGPYSTGYPLQNVTYPAVTTTQNPYMQPGNYVLPPQGQKPSASYGQPMMDGAGNPYYSNQSQQPNVYYGMQQPTQQQQQQHQPVHHPTSYSTQPVDPYSMQQLDASLPAPQPSDPNSTGMYTAPPHASYYSNGTSGQPANIYPPQPNYSELPDPPTGDVVAPSPAPVNYSNTDGVQSMGNTTTDGQLISFD